MVVSVPDSTWAGAQASPVVWRQPRLSGEDSLARERDRSQLTDVSPCYRQDGKGKYRMVLCGDVKIHLTDIYMIVLRLT